METKKIAFACCIGGTLCCGVALWLSPMYWWLGIFAGLAGGYLSYEFREVLKAISIAFSTAENQAPQKSIDLMGGTRKWFLRPHPIIYASLILSALFNWWIHSLGTTMPMLLSFCACMVVFSVLIGTSIGDCLKRQQNYYVDTDDERYSEWCIKLIEKGYTEVPLTYTNAARWVIKGIGLNTIEFCITVIGLFYFIAECGRDMFLFIHKEERVSCAIDGTIGGLISFLLFADTAVTFPEKVMVTICGGLLGAAVGVIATKIARHLQVAKPSNA